MFMGPNRQRGAIIRAGDWLRRDRRCGRSLRDRRVQEYLARTVSISAGGCWSVHVTVLGSARS